MCVCVCVCVCMCIILFIGLNWIYNSRETVFQEFVFDVYYYYFIENLNIGTATNENNKEIGGTFML